MNGLATQALRGAMNQKDTYPGSLLGEEDRGIVWKKESLMKEFTAEE